MPEPRPLLTIAVPTYNRAQYLREFLASALPQISGHAEVELIICNNASTDETRCLLESTVHAGEPLRVIHQPGNVGSDANFVRCFHEARGKYFWLCGDDDILRPGAVDAIAGHLLRADYDLVFVAPEPFTSDWQAEHRPDPYGRTFAVVRSARDFAVTVNVMVTFITAIISNRERFLTLSAETPDAFIGTNLTQLSWTLPLLGSHRQSLFLWERWVGGRTMNSGGYSLATVFGPTYQAVVRRLLPSKPRLARIFVNNTLRRWFPAMLLALRSSSKADNLGLHEADAVLRSTFRRNFRYWMYIWPVLRMPGGLASLWTRFGRVANAAILLLNQPGRTLRKLGGWVRQIRG